LKRDPNPARARPLKARVKPSVERQVRSGHPWVYAESLVEEPAGGVAGDLVVLYDRNNQFMALGLYDPSSPIRVRLLHAGSPVVVDEGWWVGRVGAALGRREGMFDGRTTGYRLIHGENDGMPGLVLDRYGSTLALKIYSPIWLGRLEFLADTLMGLLPWAERMVVRFSRNMGDVLAKYASFRDGGVLRGAPVAGPVEFLEAGLRFEADVLRGQKTGFFLDHRENRARVGELSRGRAVLNVFSFSGGFSLHAARGGASRVVDVDISQHALESGERNFALNRGVAEVAACPRDAVKADVFDWLAKARGGYGVVVVDPPSLAKRKGEVEGALKAYGWLAAASARLVGSRGILALASCSAHVPAELFFEATTEAIRGAGVVFEELGRWLEPADHPATFLEARYLKCVFLRRID